MLRNASKLVILVVCFLLTSFAWADPSISSISPSVGPVSPVGSPLTIKGSGFGTQSGGTVTIGGIAAVPTSWSDTRIVAPVPSSLLPGFASVIVTAGGVSSNSASFLVIPVITAVSPATAPVGGSVTITGTSFGDNQGLNTVTFNDLTATATIWTNTSITFTIPVGAQSGPIVVTSNGWQTNGVYYLITPKIDSISPSSGPSSGSVTIVGSGFGTAQNFNPVTFGGINVTPSSWSDTAITVPVPGGLPAGNANIVVSVNTIASNTAVYVVTPAILPTIASIIPASGIVGTQITITGSNFGATPGQVQIGTLPLTITSWTDTSIVATIPSGSATGNITVVSGALSSNGAPFTIIPAISSLSPDTGALGIDVIVSGSGFGTLQGTSTVTFNGTPATVSNWSDTALTVTVPSAATSGSVVVNVGGQPSNSLTFTVVTPLLSGQLSQTLTAVTLTSPLALDWAHWGTSNDQTLVRLAGITPLISDLTPIGSNSPALFSDGEIEYIWTDGDPLAAAERTTSGVSISGTGNGFHFTVQADTTAKTLILYVGANSAQAQLTASLSDNSSAPFVDSSLNAVSGNDLSGTYKIDFRAGQPGETLNIDYVLLTDNGNGTTVLGQVMLESAVLVPHLPVVAMSTPTDGQVFTYPSDIPVTASASQIDASIAKVDLFSDAQNLFEVLTAPYSFTLSGLTPGDHNLISTATDSAGLTSTSDPALVAEIQAGGSLSAVIEIPVNVDLSAGTTDWVHWGNPDSVSNIDRKAGIAPQISDITTLANGDVFTSDDTGRSVNYSWSGGTPTDSQLGTGTQVFMQGYKNGFTFTIPADTAVRTARLYLGYGFGSSRLRASLSDGSAVPWVNVFSTTDFYDEKVITFQFQAASARQNLIITDQVINDGGFAYVDLEAATVSDQNAPVISTVTPVTGGPGTALTISGSNFGDGPAGTVTLSGSALTVNSWSNSSITATLTGGYASGPLIVSRGLATSNSVPFTYIGPSVTTLVPSAGGPGTTVSIQGQSLGQTPVSVTFSGLPAAVVSQSANAIQATVPSGIAFGPSQVVVQVAGITTNALEFDVAPPPVLTSLTPNFGITGKIIRIFGSNFGPSMSDSVVLFGETQASPISWSDSVIQVPVPAGFFGGIVTVIVGGQRSNGLPFEVPFRCFTDCNAQRSSISLSPQNLSVVVGDEVDLSVVDNLGETVPFPQFTVSDSTLGVVATQNNVATLSAIAPGTLTLTATSGSLTTSTTVTIYAGPALPDGTIKWQLPTSIVGTPELFVPAQPASGSMTATFVRDDTFPHSDVIIRALNQNGRELWAWDTGTDVHTLFNNQIVPTPAGGLVYTTQLSINSLDANGHPLWSYPYPQYGFEPVTIGYDGTVYALVNFSEPAETLGSNERVTHLVALNGQTGNEKFRVPLPASAGLGPAQYSRPMVLMDGSINMAVWTGNTSITSTPNTFVAIPRDNSHDPEPEQGSTPIFCPSEVLECWAPVDLSNGFEQKNQIDTVESQQITLVNVQPDGTPHQFILSQNQVECTEFGTHYKYVLDDEFLLPGTHVGGGIHDLNGNAISDGHQYQQNLGLWSTGTCGVEPPGPNGFDLKVVPNGSGGILVTSETNDNQNPIWIMNIPQPSVSGSGTEIHIASLNTLNNLVIGENGNAFAAGSWNFFETPRLVSFNINSGTPNWTYDSPFGTPDDPGYVDLVAAGPNNSLYATEGEFFNQIPTNAFTLDTNGIRTDNPTSSQAVNYVTSAAIGSNIWLGSNETTIASLAAPDFGFGMAPTVQAGVLDQSGITAYLAVLIPRINSSFFAPSPSGTEFVSLPTSLKVLAADFIAPTYLKFCDPTDYSVVIAVKYQVLDQTKTPLASDKMQPQEQILDTVMLGQPVGDELPFWIDIGPTTYPGTSQFTDKNGQFLDAPFGQCANLPFTETFTQPISVLFNSKRYNVRINKWSLQVSPFRHGAITNQQDIKKAF